MAFIRKNLSSFARGDTWTTQFTIKSAAGLAIDITGLVFWLTLKNNPDDADPGIAQVSATAAGVPATLGIISLTFAAAVTAALTPGQFHYDLQQVDNGESPSNIQTLLMGKVIMVKDITTSTV